MAKRFNHINQKIMLLSCLFVGKRPNGLGVRHQTSDSMSGEKANQHAFTDYDSILCQNGLQ